MATPVRPSGAAPPRPADVGGRGRALKAPGAPAESEGVATKLERLHVDAIREILSKPPAERTQADVDHLFYDLVSNLALPSIQSLPPAIARDACRFMGLQELAMGDVLFNEGDVGVAMYVVLQGTLTAHVRENPLVDEPETFAAAAGGGSNSPARPSVESHLIEAEARRDAAVSRRSSGVPVSFAVRTGAFGARGGAPPAASGLAPIPDDMGHRRASAQASAAAAEQLRAKLAAQQSAALAATADAAAAQAAEAEAKEEDFDIVQKTTLSMDETVPNSAAAGLANYPVLTVSDVRDEEELSRLLQSRGIDTGKWGKGAAKTVRHLWKEIQEQETVLVDSNPCIRLLNVARLRIGRPQDDFTLLETLQSMKDGRMRNRNKLLAEKVQYGERLADAAVRACKEELGDVLEGLRRREFEVAERKRVEANAKTDAARAALRAVVSKLTTLDSLLSTLAAAARAANATGGKDGPGARAVGQPDSDSTAATTTTTATTTTATEETGDTTPTGQRAAVVGASADAETDTETDADDLASCADLELADALAVVDEHVLRAKAAAAAASSSDAMLRTELEMLDEAYGAATAAAADAHMAGLAAEDAKTAAEMARLTVPSHCTVEIETLMSQSFPDLVTRYVLYDIHVIIDGLPDDEFHTVELAHEAGAEPTTHNWRWVSPQECAQILNKKKKKKKQEAPAEAPAPAPTADGGGGDAQADQQQAAAQALVAQSLAEVREQQGSGMMSLPEVQAGLGPTVAQLAPGQTFGELALLSSDNRRMASIVATSRAVDLIVLARHVYNRALRDYDKQLQAEKLAFMRGLPCFSVFSDAQIMNLAASLRRRVLPPNTTLVGRGDADVRVFWIAKGDAVMYVPARGEEDPTQVPLGPGDVFGDGCINSSPAPSAGGSASNSQREVAADPASVPLSDVDVITTSDAVVFFLEKHNFDRFVRTASHAMSAITTMVGNRGGSGGGLPAVVV